jgi:hypothetical protein
MTEILLAAILVGVMALVVLIIYSIIENHMLSGVKFFVSLKLYV